MSRTRRNVVAAGLTALLGLSATGAPADVSAGGVDTVRIGVVAGDGASGAALIAGAERAEREWNASDRGRTRPVRLFVPPPGRKWRDGATRVARLLFDEDVVAVLGDDDATVAHVTAQLATVRRVPFITLSPEDGLTRVFDPWIFRGVPSDGEQALTLLHRVLDGTRDPVVVVAVPGGRDGRERLRDVESACAGADVRVAAVMRVARGAEPVLPAEIATADAVLAWLDPPEVLTLLHRLAREGRTAPVLGSSRLDNAPVRDLAAALDVGLMLPRLDPEALGYDLVRIVALAADESGSEPGAIRAALAAGRPWRGRSGTFRFDDRGNRVDELAASGVRAAPPSPPGGP